MLPKDLANLIDKLNLITSPELEQILDKVNKRWDYKLNTHDFAKNNERFRKEFSWEHEVVEYVQGIKLHEERVYLFLGIENSQMFLVNANWIISNFEALWKSISYEDIWIISTEYKSGLLVTCYSGYLLDDPNPKEILYAVTTWNE